MIKSSAIGRRHGALFGIAVAVLLQSMYPAGYMPASLASGWPVMLCPDGLPPGFLATNDGGHEEHGAHHQHGDPAQPAPASDTCPVGKAFDSHAVPSLATAPASHAVAVDRAQPVDPVMPAYRLRTAFRSRAPPLCALI